jgi:hypothetical protein
MSISRILSLVVAGCYLAGGLYYFHSSGDIQFAKATIGLVILNAFCLACIWFPDLIGNWRVGKAYYGLTINPTPEGFVKFVGWALFFLPPIVYVLGKIIFESLS